MRTSKERFTATSSRQICFWMRGTVWITDFGLAKVSADSDLTHSGDVVGTIRYMAPERFAGRCDARSDVYALGLTLYELLAKRPAFEALDRNQLLQEVTQGELARLRRINRAIPRDLDTIVFKAIEKEPSHRYSSAAALAEDLRRYLQDRPIAARRTPAIERLVRWGRRNPLLATLVTAIFMLLATVASISTKLAFEISYRAGISNRLREQTLQANAIYVSQQQALERLLYATTVQAAQSAWEADDVRLCRDMLESVRPKRGNGPDPRGFEWYYWHRRFRPAIRSLVGHRGPIACVALDRDGSRIASGGFDGSVRIWNATSGELLRVLAGHEIVHSVAFSPESTQVAAADDDGKIRIWSTTTGHLLQELRGHEGVVWSVAYAPDGKRLASAGADSTTKLWDADSGILLHSQRGKVTHRRNAAFSPDGQRIASATGDRTVTIWDASSGKETESFTFGREEVSEPISLISPLFGTVRFSADGASMFADSAGPFGLLEWFIGKLTSSPASQVRFIETYNSYRSFQKVLDFDVGRDGRISRLDSDGTIRIQSKADGSERIALDLGPADIRTLALSPDGSRLVTAGPGAAVTVWDVRPDPSVRSFEEPASIARGAPSQIPGSCLAVSPDGKQLACAGGAMPVRVRDVETGRVLLEFSGQAGSIQTIAYSPDGRYIASAGSDKLIHICDATNGRQRVTLQSGGEHVSCMAFSPDGTTLASVGLGSPVRVWEVESGVERFQNI